MLQDALGCSEISWPLSNTISTQTRLLPAFSCALLSIRKHDILTVNFQRRPSPSHTVRVAAPLPLYLSPISPLFLFPETPY